MAAEEPDDEENESEVHNVVGSREVDGEIDVVNATEEFGAVQERDNWTGRVWHLNDRETALIWESGTILVVGGAMSENDVDRITAQAENRLENAGLINE